MAPDSVKLRQMYVRIFWTQLGLTRDKNHMVTENKIKSIKATIGIGQEDVSVTVVVEERRDMRCCP